jgi:ribosomal protein S18 acetylase RimI-like enzyme
MTILQRCECGADVESENEATFADAFLVHARAEHPDWAQFPDVGVRNYGDALLRLDGPSDRLDAIGGVEIHPVTEDRIEDWTAFFDHDGFVGRPEWAACYCTEPHLQSPISDPPSEDHRTWRENRELEQQQLRDGRSFGYLAYVDGKVGGWVNASKRSSYSLFRENAPEDADVIGVSCFVIGPAYRRHGIAGKLLDRVVADAAGRGAAFVEAYPFVATREDNDSNFRGSRSLYETRGFEAADERERYTVMRRRA